MDRHILIVSLGNSSMTSLSYKKYLSGKGFLNEERGEKNIR